MYHDLSIDFNVIIMLGYIIETLQNMATVNDLPKVARIINWCIPRYGRHISDPYNAIAQKRGNCISNALVAHSLNPELTILRHRVLSGKKRATQQMGHFACFDTSGTETVVVDRIWSSTEACALALYLDFWKDFVAPVKNEFVEDSRELIGGVLNGEYDKAERELGASRLVRVNLVEPEALLAHAVGRLGGNFDNIADLALIVAEARSESTQSSVV